MGGMKEEAKRITIPPLFPKVHVNDTRSGWLSQPFDGNSTSLYKHSTLPSLTNKISDSPSTLSLSLPPPANNTRLTEKNHFTPICNTSPTLSLEEKLNKNGMDYPSPRGSSVTNTNHHFKKTHLYRRRTVRPREQNDVSDRSAIDSLSGIRASSNDVARVIDDKRFWKMRIYMINQQKIFAAQVFELHRLIMVQKMVAKSPNLVLESKLNGGKRGAVRSKHMKLKLPPLPSIKKDTMTPIWTQQLLPPPGNQWLVPVMSPSEGLVYKPYTGPSPTPSSAFMVPFYGQDLLDTALRFPVSTQFSHNYFPQPNARTPLDQTNPFGQLQRWSGTHQAIPFSLKKSEESNESDVHGSTASSPPEKHKFDVLPIFPTEPTHHTDEYEQTQQPVGRAIKAIPHDSTTASESAARIFRFIQEERRDSDHMIS